MKKEKNYKILMILAIIIVLGLIIFLIVKNIINKRKLEDEFKDLASNYYEIYSKQNIFGINEGETLTYSLRDLKELNYNISDFEKNECNLKESKAIIEITKNGYNIDIKLDC